VKINGINYENVNPAKKNKTNVDVRKIKRSDPGIKTNEM
jgi:hypothetical protein